MRYETFARGLIRRNRTAGAHVFQDQQDDYLVSEGVFSPSVFNDTPFFAQALPVPSGGTVLEIGCGAGVIALAAARGGAGSVLATDVSGVAVTNSQANVDRAGLGDVIEVRQSDVFDRIAPDEQFDLIFWNCPYLAAPRDDSDSLECSVFDPGYLSIGRYLRDAPSHLAPGGRVMLSFSQTCGDRALMAQRAEQAAAELSVVATRSNFDGAWVVELLEATYPTH